MSETSPHVPADVASAEDPWPSAPPAPDGPTLDVPADPELGPSTVPPSASSRARSTADTLDASAVLAIPAALMVGVGWWLARLLPIGQAPSPALAVEALVILGAGAFLGVVTRQSLTGLAALLRVQAEQADASGRLEQRLAEGFGGLLAAIEAMPRGTPGPSVSDEKYRRAAEVRHAVRSGLWADADDLVRTFQELHPDDPETARLAEEVAAARETAAKDRLARIEAAREVNDPERVIELRDELKTLLPPDALRTLDRDLAKWFLLLIHRRLRSGTVRADVAVLAGRVSESLGETPEGASLRASLPTLRRAAGLCPRCAQPYTGFLEACPACQSGGAVSHASLPTPAPGVDGAADGRLRTPDQDADSDDPS